MLTMKMTKPFLAVLTVLFAASTAHAQEFEIEIKNHVFQPSEITIPVDQKVKLTITNHDTTPAEFESFELNREKVINGGSKAVVFVGPLKAGRYEFFDEFHKDTTHGVIIAQ